MTYRILFIAGLAAALSAGCWADFPDSKLAGIADSRVDDRGVGGDSGDGPLTDTAGDAGSSDGVSDTAVSDTTTGDTAPGDATPRDSTPPDTLAPDTFCPPNSFVECKGANLRRCSASGKGVDTTNCAPATCSTSLKRCDQCDPTTPPSCSGKTLTECRDVGLTRTTICAIDCQNGKCCLDGDNDKFSTCQNDCDDNNNLINPGQTAFFATPTSRGYDYNCDNTEEREDTAVVNCVRQGASCTGHGWSGAVPGCGASGTYITCAPQGPSNCRQNGATKTQRCR